MFPKKLRLHTTRDIQTILRYGRSFIDGQVVLKYYDPLRAKTKVVTGAESQRDISEKQSQTEIYKFTVIISKKAHTKAVVRNRFKRIIRARLQSAHSQLKPGWYTVLIRGKVDKTAEAKILNQLSSALMRAEK